jgi:hypothetical protein
MKRPLRFHAAAILVAAFGFAGCRAHYLGSYQTPDGGDTAGAGTGSSGSAGAAGSTTTSTTSTGAAGAGGDGAGGSGAGTAGAGGSTAGSAGAGGGEAGSGNAGAGMGGAGGGQADADAPDAANDVSGDAGSDAAPDEASTDGSPPDAVASDAACSGVVLPAPVAEYTFDDCDDNADTLHDTSSFGIDLTKVGKVRCAGGHDGVAVYFAGDPTTGVSYLTVPEFTTVPVLANTLTVSMWISVWEARYVNLLGRWFGADSFLILSDGTDFIFTAALPDGEGGVGLDYHARSPLVLYKWVHLVGVFDGKSIALYADGKLAEIAPIDPPGALQQTERPLQMGGLAQAGSFFRGMLDEVRLYDVALDAAQVRALDCKP